MPRTKPRTAPADRLLDLPIEKVCPFPGNPNRMPEEYLDKLETNIAREGDYPPLIVRPHPLIPDSYDLLDGEQRLTVLRRRGVAVVRCYLWPCDDQTALVLRTTLNQLRGDDQPWMRAALLRQLAELIPLEDLEKLVPETEPDLSRLIYAVDGGLEELLERFTREADQALAVAPRLYSFAVDPDDASSVDAALELALSGLSGQNRRARAFVRMARSFLEHGEDADA